jgi:hypothetical protein
MSHCPGSSQRNDADIARSAESALQWTTFLPKDAVKIMVEGGWVTLTGEIGWERQSASAAVRYLMGVTGVSDQIPIKPKVHCHRSEVGHRGDLEAARTCRDMAQPDLGNPGRRERARQHRRRLLMPRKLVSLGPSS